MVKEGIIRTATRLFRGRRKDYVAQYLHYFESIEKMLDKKVIGIDLERCVVVLDVSVHVLLMEDDKAYNAFMEKIRLYMNYRLSAIKAHPCEYIKVSDRINFYVVLKHIRWIGDDGELLETQEEKTDTLLVGKYQDGKVNYVAYQEN